MSLYSRPNGTDDLKNDPALDPDIGEKIDIELNQIIAIINNLDNANISGAPKIAASKIDFASGGYVEDIGDDMTGTLGHIFDGLWRYLRASGTARLREYFGSDGALWGLAYNTEWNGADWDGRDVTGVCLVLKLESDGFHVYYAVSAAATIVPSWTEIFHANASGVLAVTDSVDQNTIASAAVGQGELNTATASSSISVAANAEDSLTLTGGTYSWWTASAQQTGGGGSSEGMGFANDNVAAGIIGVGNPHPTNPKSFYIDERYVQASPPYMIGNTIWGHFVYFLRRVSTGEIVGASEAKDPTWGHNGAFWLPKAHKDRIITAPHPFASYWQHSPFVKNPRSLTAYALEVVLIDLRDFDIETLRIDAWKNGETMLERLERFVVIGVEKPHIQYGLPTIPGFTDTVKIRARV